MKICLTGSTGFVGSATLDALMDRSLNVSCLGRRKPRPVSTQNFISIDFEHIEEVRSEVLCGFNAIIHLAAINQSNQPNIASKPNEYQKINRDVTLRLAEMAASAGVKRFIFLSTAKVNGENSPDSNPLSTEDTCAPKNDYAISKLEAEKGLRELAKNVDMDVVIIRPPLIYGPNVSGNFEKLISLVKNGTPLPFARIKNQRSFVALDNLIDLIITCLDHPLAANETFFVSDGQDLSTPELIRYIAKILGTPDRLFHFPPFLLDFFALSAGKKHLSERLIGTLQVDISKTKELLGWNPPLTVEEGLKKCLSEGLNF